MKYKMFDFFMNVEFFFFFLPSTDGKGKEIKQLIHDFVEAWDYVRESLSSFSKYTTRRCFCRHFK